MDNITLKRLGVPALVLLVFLLPTLYWDVLLFRLGSEIVKRALRVGHYVFGVCLWLTLAWFTIRILNELVWPLLFEQRLGYTIPRLFKDFVHLIVLAIAVGTIVSVVFEKSLTGFLAASGVLGFILGFALRSLIADFFSGISLNLERSFTLGDRIRLESGEQGEVIEINWRTTIIQTIMGNQIIVPNSRISFMRLDKRPEIAEGLTQIIARYRLRDAAMAKHLTQAEQEVEVESLASQLLHKMRSFFNIFRRPAGE